MLFVAGIVGVFAGISAIAGDNVYVATPDYIYKFNLSTWGWIHLIIGIIAIVVAGGLAVGSGWARVSAIIIASLSIIAQFLWLPYNPWWAILIIVLDLVVIWAVSTWEPDVV